MMRHHQVGRINLGWNLAITKIAEFVRDIECFLSLQMHSARGDNRDRALGQLAIEWSERNAFA